MSTQPKGTASAQQNRIPRVRSSLTLLYQPGLEPGAGTTLLRDHETDTLIALTRDEELVVRALQFFEDLTTPSEICELCQRKFGAEMTTADILTVARRLRAMCLLEQKEARGDIAAAQVDRRREIMRAEQVEFLRQMLMRIFQEIPYYRQKLCDHNLKLDTLDELRNLPVTSKEEVRRNLATLVPADHGRFAVEWRSTSGTTGERLQAPHAGGYMYQSMANVFRMNSWFYRRVVGLPWCALTTPLCSGTECHMEMELSYEDRLLHTSLFGPNGLYLNSVLNPTRFPTAKLDAIIEEIKRHGARYLRCDSWYALPLALRIMETRPSLPRFEAVLLTYEIPSRIHKRIISRALDCPVIESYGSNECGDMALEIEDGVFAAPHHATIIEILDASGEPVAPGQVGRVYVTTLQKHSMPLLRYQSTDLARAAEHPDRYPEFTFASVEGRLSDVITDRQGRPITPRELDRVVSEVGAGIGWYQLVQTDAHCYRFRAVPIEGYSEATETAVAEALHDFLGTGIDLSISTTRDLTPSSSGKFRICYQSPVRLAGGDEPQSWLVTEDWF